MEIKNNNEKSEDISLITFRGASSFGFTLANNLAEQLEKDGVPPSKWPKKFPITLGQIKKLPRIGNDKIARKVGGAARAIWKDMCERALEMEKDMALHPEFYMNEEINQASSYEEHLTQWAWRHLSVEIEQLAGDVYVTEFGTDEMAKSFVYKNLGVEKIKQHMEEFEDDFGNYINEVRKVIRDKKYIKALDKMELIVLIHSSMLEARKPLPRVSRKRSKEMVL